MTQQFYFWVYITNSKECMHPYIFCALFTTVNIWKQLKCLSIDKWIKKWWYTYTMEYHSAIKMNEILIICDSMDDLEDIMLSEIHHTETSII